MGASIAGAIVGGTLGLWRSYEEKRENDKKLKLAEKQFELAKKTAEQEEQERNKANQKEVDIEGLLNDNTEFNLGNGVLTGPSGANKKIKLSKKAASFGGQQNG